MYMFVLWPTISLWISRCKRFNVTRSGIDKYTGFRYVHVGVGSMCFLSMEHIIWDWLQHIGARYGWGMLWMSTLSIDNMFQHVLHCMFTYLLLMRDRAPLFLIVFKLFRWCLDACFTTILHHGFLSQHLQDFQEHFDDTTNFGGTLYRRFQLNEPFNKSVEQLAESFAETVRFVVFQEQKTSWNLIVNALERFNKAWCRCPSGMLTNHPWKMTEKSRRSI